MYAKRLAPYLPSLYPGNGLGAVIVFWPAPHSTVDDEDIFFKGTNVTKTATVPMMGSSLAHNTGWSAYSTLPATNWWQMLALSGAAETCQRRLAVMLKELGVRQN